MWVTREEAREKGKRYKNNVAFKEATDWTDGNNGDVDVERYVTNIKNNGPANISMLRGSTAKKGATLTK